MTASCLLLTSGGPTLLAGSLFSAPTSFASAQGSLPQGTAAADFNGDGKLDLAVANSGNNTVSILLAGTNGTFSESVGSPFAVGSAPQAVVVGDFNNDGKWDVAVANSGSNTITVLLGNGNGGFTTAAGSPFTVGTSPQSMAVGDFNGDGTPDLAVANSGSNNVTVLLGNGSGGFNASGSPIAAGTSPVAIVADDFNRDSKLDLAVASSSGLTILGGAGGGAFTVGSVIQSPSVIGPGPSGLAVADLNGDSVPDIAVSTSAGVTVLLGNGVGGFNAAGASIPAGSNPSSIAAADFNGDGKIDLVITNKSSSTLTALLGDGTGGFAGASGSPFAVGTSSSPASVTVADFNGDGKPDAAVANNTGVAVFTDALPSLTANPAQLAFNLGLGQLAPPGINVSISSQAGSAATYSVTTDQPWLTANPTSAATGSTSSVSISLSLAQLNSKALGAVRFNAPGYYGAATSVLLNFAGPSGTLTAAHTYPTGNAPASILTGNFGSFIGPDLAMASQSSGIVSIFLSSGNGAFNAGNTVPTGSTADAIVSGDFNRDGWTDLAVANGADNTVTVLLGAAFGAFSVAPGSPFPAGNRPQALVTGDFNGDGRLDLAVLDRTDNQVAIYLGTGNGAFGTGAGLRFSVGNSPRSLVVGDFNGDGKLDLATANSGSNNITVLLGNGAGGFTEAVASPFAAGNAPVSLVATDLNRDGKLDLAAVNSAGNSATVLLGDGNGGFTAVTGSPFTVGSTPQSIAVGDLNGDGNPDLVAANGADDNLSVLLGDGNGGFSTRLSFATGTGPGAIAISDFSGDGRLDLAVVNRTSNTLSILLGDLAATTASLTILPASSVTAGQQVTLSSQVAASQAFASPTGSVQFLDSTSVLGSGNIANGVASFTTAGLAVGSHTVSAKYIGDTRSSRSTSASQSLVVTAGPTWSIVSSHTGSFRQGQNGATYTLTITNTGAAASSGSVSVSDTVPTGLTLVSMSGSAWSCSANTCTRTDALSSGQSYGPITVTVNVSATAASSLTNQASVSGGGAATSNTSDLTVIQAAGPSKVGIFRQGFLWVEDVDGNEQINVPPDRAFAFGGVPGDIPVTGDWNGSGTMKAGVFRPNHNGQWLLDWDGTGQNPRVYYFGGTGDVPVVGDWTGTGTTKIGIVHQGFLWVLDSSGNGAMDNTNIVFPFGGVPGDLPLVGDWNGDGVSKPGFFRQGYLFVLDMNGNHQIDAGDAVFPFGGYPGDVPLVGDWTGAGVASVGILRQGFLWILDANRDHQIDAGDYVFVFGGYPGDKPVVGRW